nr:hypothetical protein TgIb.0030 [Toxoplasma gondii RH]
MVQSQCALPRAEPHFAKEGHTFLSHVSRVNCHASCDALGGLAPTPIVVLNNNAGRYVCTSEPHSFMATATHFTSCSTVDSWLTACSWSRATTCYRRARCPRTQNHLQNRQRRRAADRVRRGASTQRHVCRLTFATLTSPRDDAEVDCRAHPTVRYRTSSPTSSIPTTLWRCQAIMLCLLSCTRRPSNAPVVAINKQIAPAATCFTATTGSVPLPHLVDAWTSSIPLHYTDHYCVVFHQLTPTTCTQKRRILVVADRNYPHASDVRLYPRETAGHSVRSVSYPGVICSPDNSPRGNARDTPQMLPPLAHHAVVYAAVSSPQEINTVSPLAPLLRSRPHIHANAKPDRFGRQAPIWYQDTMTTRPITSNHSATRRHTGRVQTENARSLTGDAHACAKVNPLAESTGSHPTIMATIAEAVAVGRKHWTSTRSRYETSWNASQSSGTWPTVCSKRTRHSAEKRRG